jgi:hypothetical protein
MTRHSASVKFVVVFLQVIFLITIKWTCIIWFLIALPFNNVISNSRRIVVGSSSRVIVVRERVFALAGIRSLRRFR